MRRRLILPFFAASTLIFAQTQLPSPSRSAKVGDRNFDAAGVCEANPEGVKCWDLDRKPLPSAEENLRSLSANGTDLTFRIGKKNRYLVVRRPRDFNLNYRLSISDYAGYISNYQGDPVYDFIKVAVDGSLPDVSLSAQVWVPADRDVDVPMQEGSKANIEGRTLEIGKASLGKGNPQAPGMFPMGQSVPSPHPWWSVIMGIDGDLSQGLNWGMTPIGRDGKPIAYVDAKGEPMSAVKAMSEGVSPDPFNGGYVLPDMQGTPGKKPKAFVAYFRSNGYGSAFRSDTNVNPRSIAAIRIKWSRPVTVALGPFPLDSEKTGRLESR